MARIANVNIPDNKKVHISLSYIHGLGIPSSIKICRALNISLDKKTSQLTEEELIALRKEISENYLVESDLRKEVSMNIKKHIEIGTYQGKRHLAKLPVRGQNTHCNAKTRRKAGSGFAAGGMQTKKSNITKTKQKKK